MKTYLFLFLLLFNNVQSQTTRLNQSAENNMKYFKSHSEELLDENGNSIFYPVDPDTLLMTGENTNNDFGFSVSSAGDVNGDGYSDVIVGAYRFNSNVGRAYIFYGGENLNNVADKAFYEYSSNGQFGISVSTAGDVNNDGYSDVIIGQYNYLYLRGKAYIYYGGANMDIIADVIMMGEKSNNNFGWSVSSAGDVNNDGFSDVLVGAWQYGSDSGRVYLYFGGVNMNNIADLIMTGDTSGNRFGWSVSSAGDVNNDGFSDIIAGAHGYYSNSGKAYIFYGGLNMDNIADVTMTGDASGDNFGWSVSSAGDVNYDGFSDVIVGAYGYSTNKGRVSIFYGGESMNIIPDVTLTGEASGNNFGYSVSSAGDINGDGFSDIIIGAKGYNSNTGRAYLFYGGVIMDTIADILMTGDVPGYNFGCSVSSAGDVNMNGYSDVIIGAFGYNSRMGRAYLYYNIIPLPELIYPGKNTINNPLNITFMWKKYYSAAYYVLKVSTDSVFSNVVVNDTLIIDTNRTISGFQKDTRYYWKIKAVDSSGLSINSYTSNFRTLPPIKVNLKILMEGMYYPVFNQMSRKDTVKVYLRNVSSPYSLIDSSAGVIDSLTFSGLFDFNNTSSGTYYIVVKHFNSIETWSKSSGEPLNFDGSVYNYDFTSSISQAFGNNLKLKIGKYCIYSGDLNQDEIIDASDLSEVDNASYEGLTGRYLNSDVNGNGYVDATDVSIVDNNRSVITISP